jgi:hypothetical protein
MAKLQHCGYCGHWFRPDPRNAGRQQACSSSACQAKRHQKDCRAWRRRNAHYDKEDRLVETLVKDPAHAGTDPVDAIDWQAAMDLVGPEVAVLVKECGKAICQRRWGDRAGNDRELPSVRRETPSPCNSV